MPWSVLRHVRVAPSPSIARAVDALIVHDFDGEVPHVAIPHAEIDLLFRFGPAARRGLDAHAFGARSRVHRKTPRGVVRTVAARIRLGATEAILGVPAKEIAGRVVGLDDLWGAAAAEEALDRLGGAESAAEATRAVERVLAARLRTAPRPPSTSRLVLDAAEKLADAPVHVVAGELGVSERHLRRIFRESIGLGPKAFAKLARFRRALDAAREDRTAGWAQIAVTTGYYDQAHLIAEFRAIAGKTPLALLGELRAGASLL